MQRREFLKQTAFGALTALAMGCGTRTSGFSSRLIDRRNYNVLLITVDSWNPYHLGCYGYDRPTTPALDDFVKKHCVRFTEATTPSGWTLPSFIAMQSGRHVLNHRVRGMRRTIGAKTPLLAELIHDSLPHTNSFMGEKYGFVKSVYGFDRGFDKSVVVYQNRAEKMEDLRDANGGQPIGLDPERYAMAAKELRRLKDAGQPFFFWKYTNDAHNPYVAYTVEDNPFQDPEDVEKLKRGEKLEGIFHPQLMNRQLEKQRDVGYMYDEMQGIERIYTNQYDGGLRFVDDGLSKTLAEVEEILDDTVVIITADHGESMAEPHHGPFGLFYTHGQPYESCNRIPLMVHVPGIEPGECSALVQLQDIAPTVLDLLGHSPVEGMDGRSLAPLLTGEAESVRDVAVAWNGWSMIRTSDGTKAISAPDDWDPKRTVEGPKVTSPCELYDVRSDPEERTNLFERSQDQHGALMARYSDMDARYEALGPADIREIAKDEFHPEHFKGLKALGYL